MTDRDSILSPREVNSTETSSLKLESKMADSIAAIYQHLNSSARTAAIWTVCHSRLRRSNFLVGTRVLQAVLRSVHAVEIRPRLREAIRVELREEGKK